ncbi:MAG: hypothetical protein PHN75_17480, partial [Syntrophales bacterium]|nr:hypothetical protein [Syntrophales bacterium]
RWLGQRRNGKRSRYPGDHKRGHSMTDMTGSRVVLDPTNEKHVIQHDIAARPVSLRGLAVGLLDISKARGDVFLNQLERRLVGIGATVKRFRKPTFAKPAPVDLRHELATSCDAVIEALAD